MAQVAASPVAERGHETSQDGLWNDHSALAACRRVRRCIRQRNAHRNRSARTHLDQCVRYGFTPECVGDAYAGGRSARRGVPRIRNLYHSVRSRAPHPVGRGSPARTYRSRAGKTGCRQHRPVLGLLRHNAGADDQRRVDVFWLFRWPRYGNAALVRNLGDTRLCRPSYLVAL